MYIGVFSRDVGWQRIASFYFFFFLTADCVSTVGLWGVPCFTGSHECCREYDAGFHSIATYLLRNMSVVDC